MENDAFIIRSGVLEQYTGSETIVTVPAGVKEIGAKAFEQQPVEKVILPAGLQKISDSAFYECKELWEINLPESLTYLGKYVFCGCKKLQAVSIPAGVKHISFKAFQYCRELSSLTLAEGVTQIGDYAFASCNELTEVSFPSSLRRIGVQSFARTSLRSLTLPEGVERIEEGAFEACTCIVSVTLPKSLQEVGYDAFTACFSLDPAQVSVPLSLAQGRYNVFDEELALQGFCTRCCKPLEDEGDGRICKWCGHVYSKRDITPHGRMAELIEKTGKIPTGRFHICKDVLESYIGEDDEVTIPDFIKTVAAKAFYGNQHLVKVTIPDSVERIGAEAFRGCTALRSVTMPDTVFVEMDAFRDCTALDPEQTHISENVQNRVLAGTGFLEKGYCEYCGGRIHYAALFWICSRCGKVYRD